MDDIETADKKRTMHRWIDYFQIYSIINLFCSLLRTEQKPLLRKFLISST